MILARHGLVCMTVCLVTGFLLLAGTAVSAEELTVRTDLHGDALPEGAIARLGTVRLRHGDTVCSLAFSPDGKLLASGGDDRVIRLWDLASGREMQRLSPDGFSFSSLAFRPDGKVLVSACWAGENAIQFWDVATGKRLQRTIPHKDARAVLFSPAGATLASVGDLEVHLWGAASGRHLRELPGSTDFSGLGLAFSPDGKLLAVRDHKGLDICLWETGSGKLVRRCRATPRTCAPSASPRTAS